MTIVMHLWATTSLFYKGKLYHRGDMVRVVMDKEVVRLIANKVLTESKPIEQEPNLPPKARKEEKTQVVSEKETKPKRGRRKGSKNGSNQRSTTVARRVRSAGKAISEGLPGTESSD